MFYPESRGVNSTVKFDKSGGYKFVNTPFAAKAS